MLPTKQGRFELFQKESYQILFNVQPEGQVVSISYGLAVFAAFLFSHGILFIDIWNTYVVRTRIGLNFIWTCSLVFLLDINILFGSAKWGDTEVSLKAWMLVVLVVPMLRKDKRILILLTLVLAGALIFMLNLQEVLLYSHHEI